MAGSILSGLVLEEVTRPIIMVVGVGGAGGNALDHMIDLGIDNVTFVACNTDGKALAKSKAGIKVQLGSGLGAGNNPERGSQAAKESADDIVNILRSEGTQMLFITAGMGGGTGTGASPIIAKAAKSLDILTVGIVSLPLYDEGPKRLRQAQKGMEELSEAVDSLVIVHNDNISKIYGELPFAEAFAKADNILAYAAKSIAELITRHDMVNVDLEDVRSVMLNSGLALMGTSTAKGEDRINSLIERTLGSPLLNYKEIKGAKKILYNLAYGPNSRITMSEVTRILKLIQTRANGRTNKNQSDIIWGAGEKPELDDEIELTIIATGFSDIDLSTVISGNLETQGGGRNKEPDNKDNEPDDKGQRSVAATLIEKGEIIINRIFGSVDDDVSI